MRAAVAFVVLVVLSGCTGPLGSDAGTIETVTPAPVPTATLGPPGLSVSSDTVDAARLVAAHERVVENGSVAVSLESTRRPLPNGSERRRIERSASTADPTVFYDYTNDSIGFTRGVWSNGTHTVTHVRNPDVISFRIAPSPSRPEDPLEQAHGTQLRAWFTHSQSQSIDRVATAAGERYRVRATSTDDRILGSVLSRDDVANATLVATIRPDGLITSLRLTYTLITQRGRFETTHRLTTTSGVETLPRPAWVDRAVATGNVTRDR